MRGARVFRLTCHCTGTDAYAMLIKKMMNGKEAIPMAGSVTAKRITARELSPALRRRLNLVPDDEVNITVTRASARKAPRRKDPWAEVRGILSPAQADAMLRAIHASRRSKNDPPELDAR